MSIANFLTGLKRAIVVAEKVGTVAAKVKQGAESAQTLAEMVKERKADGLCPTCGAAANNTPAIAQGLCEKCLGKLTSGLLKGAELFK